MRCDKGERSTVLREHDLFISEKILLSEDQ
jgi:hypothetical protein